MVRDTDITATTYNLGNDYSHNSSINLPSKASCIKVSFDGRYLAYLIEGHIEVIELRTSKKVKTIKHIVFFVFTVKLLKRNVNNFILEFFN